MVKEKISITWNNVNTHKYSEPVGYGYEMPTEPVIEKIQSVFPF